MRQTELASLVGVTQASISRYLHGKNRPRPNVARKLEQQTGIKLEVWLFAEKDELRELARTMGFHVR